MYGIVTEYPDLDCVFLNAGFQSPFQMSRPDEFDFEAFHKEMNLNFTSIVNMSLKFLGPLLKKDYKTSLIVTGSGLGLIPACTLPAYSASKAALLAFWDCLRAQNAGTNVAFTHIAPPAVQSTLSLAPLAAVANSSKRNSTIIWESKLGAIWECRLTSSSRNAMAS